MTCAPYCYTVPAVDTAVQYDVSSHKKQTCTYGVGDGPNTPFISDRAQRPPLEPTINTRPRAEFWTLVGLPVPVHCLVRTRSSPLSAGNLCDTGVVRKERGMGLRLYYCTLKIPQGVFKETFYFDLFRVISTPCAETDESLRNCARFQM